MFNKYSIF